MAQCSVIVKSTGTNCKNPLAPGESLCTRHLAAENKRKAEEPKESKVRKKAAPEHDDGFKNLPITQIVCNLTQSLRDAQKLPCTDIGNKMAANFVRVAATRIFSNPYQSIMELVSNAIDAETHNKNAIGRFGMGFFSIFSLLLKTKDFDKLTVKTTQELGRGKKAVLQTLKLTVVNQDGALVAGLSAVKPERETGTFVRLSAGKPLKTGAQNAIKEMVNRYQFSEAARITVNKKKINAVQKENQTNVIVDFDHFSFSVRDHGAGMGKQQIATLLTPSSSSKGLKVADAEEEEKDTVRCILAKADRFGLILCANGVQIKQVELRGDARSKEKETALSVILLPSSTKLPVARNDVILSDPVSFSNMVKGFEQLITLHIGLKSVTKLRALVSAYASESKQTEAYKLVDHVNRIILASGVLLIPEDNVGIKTVCETLNLPFVESDLYSVSDLEHRVVEAAREKHLVQGGSFFEYSTAIVLPLLERPVMKMPFLSGLVFVRPSTTADEISAFCENQANGCMTKNQFDALTKAQLIQNFAAEDILTGFFKGNQAFVDRVNFILAAPLDSLIKNVNILWQNRFSKIISPSLEKYVLHLLTLLARVVVDLDSCSEVLSVFAGKLRGAIISPGYAGASFKATPLISKHFIDLRPTNFKARIAKGVSLKNITAVKSAEPIPEMVLELLKHDISVFPDKIEPGSTLPYIGQNVLTSVINSLEVSNFKMEDTCTVLAEVHRNSVHIVESCIIMILFHFYDEMYEVTSVGSWVQVTRRIRSELRQQVSLSTMLRTYNNLQTNGRDHERTALANIIQPICNILPIIHRAVVGTELAVWVSEATTFFNGWASLGPPDAEYKFSINDVMMFAYTDKRLQTSEDFMKPGTLASLAKFARRANRDCPIQAVTIAANFGNTKRVVASVVSELFQNSIDAINGSDLPAEKRRIDIGVNDKQLNFKDGVGIKDSSIMSLLVPFFSEKSGELNANGEMGTGAFNLFRKPLCDHVIFATKYKKSYVKIVATPLVNAGLVTDVDLHFAIFNNSEMERGTEICLFFDVDKVDGVDVACQVHLECLSHFFAAPFPVFLNKVHINEEKLEDVYVADGILTARGVPSRDSLRPSILTINGLPFGPLAENWRALMGPFAELRERNAYMNDNGTNMQLGTQTNFVIDIDRSQINPVQNRTEIVFKSFSTLKFHVERAQMMWILSLYAQNKLTDSFIPHTESVSTLNQIQFYDGPVFETWHSGDWLPRDFNDFTMLLHWVIRKTISLHVEDEKGAATAIINRMEVNQILKDAMLRWFKTKKTSPKPVEHKLGKPPKKLDPEDDLDWQVNEIVTKKTTCADYTIEAFIKAFLETFNAAINDKILTFSTCNTARVDMARGDTAVPTLKIVIDKFRFDAEGLWSPRHQTLLLSWQFRGIAKGLVNEVKRQDPKKLHDVFATLVRNHFFTDKGSTIIHELFHCIFDSSHSQVLHSELKMTWNDETIVNTFDGMTTDVYNKLCELDINPKFLQNLREKNILPANDGEKK